MGDRPDGTLSSHDLERALVEPAHRVSPRARVLWALGALIGGLVLAVPGALWWWFDEGHRDWSRWLLLAVLVMTVADVLVMPFWRYAVHRWEATEAAVVARSGWWTQERRVAPISRVQTVDLERGPIARALGLATVTVTTASSAGAVKLEGLDLVVAEDLVSRLTRVTDQTPGDAT